jgi:hypothetical protein
MCLSVVCVLTIKTVDYMHKGMMTQKCAVHYSKNVRQLSLFLIFWFVLGSFINCINFCVESNRKYNVNGELNRL